MSANIIVLVLNILLGVFCFIGFLFGLGRGLKKAGLRIGVFFVFVLLIALFTPMISSLLAGIQLPFLQNMSLHEFMKVQIESSPEITTLLTDVPALESIVSQFPLIAVNIVVYIVSLYVIGFVGYIVYLILKKIFIKKNKKKKNLEPNITIINGTPVILDKPVKEKKRRLLGGLVGALQGFCLLLATLVPITGVIGMVSQFVYAPAVSASEGHDRSKYTAVGNYLIDNNILSPELLGYLDSYNSSVVAKTTTMFGIDKVGFDAITSMKVNGERIKIRQEITFIVEAVNDVPFVFNMLDSASGFDFNEMTAADFDSLEKAIDSILSSKILKVLLPEIIPYVVEQLNITEYQGVDIRGNIDKIVDLLCNNETMMETLKSDVKAVIKVAKVIVTNGILSEIQQEPVDTSSIISILKADVNEDGKDYDVAFELFDGVLSSTTFRNLLAEGMNIGISFLEKSMQDGMMPENYTGTLKLARIKTENVNWTNTANSWKEIVKNALMIYEEVADQTFESPDDWLNSDYEKIITSGCEIINQLVNSPIFDAGSLDLENANSPKVNVYRSIMEGLNASEFGEYINFVATDANNFWTENAQLMIDIVAYAKNYVDIENFDYDTFIETVDFDATEDLIEDILGSSALNCVKSNVFKLIKDIDFGTGEYSAQLKATVDNIVDDFVRNNASIGGMSSDVLGIYRIAREVMKSGIVEKFQAETIDIKEIIELLKLEDANNKNLTDRVTEHLFSGANLKNVFVDLLNLGLDIGEEAIESFVGEEGDIGRVSETNINWNTIETQFKTIFNKLLEVEFLDEPMVLNVPDDTISIPVDIVSSIDTLGNVLQDLKNLDIFNYGTDKNVIDDILVELDKKLNKYLDVTTLTGDVSVKAQFTSLKNIVKALLDSGVVTDLSNARFDFSVVNISEIANKLSAKIDVDGQEKTYTNIVFTNLLGSDLVRSGLINALDEVNKGFLAEFAESLSTQDNTVMLVINKEALNDESAKANIIAFFENAVSYLKTVDIDDLESDTINTLLGSDLALVGSLLDNIKGNSLFGPIDGEAPEDYKGLYVSLIDALSTSDYSTLLDFSVAKQNDFTWNTELSTVETAIDAMLTKRITVLVESVPTEKNLIQFITDGGDYSKLIEELTEADIENIVSPIIDSKLFVSLVKTVLNTAVEKLNTTINNPLNVIPEFSTTTEIVAQKAETVLVIKKMLPLLKLENFELTDGNAETIGTALNALNANANRAGDIGAFKPMYDGILTYLYTMDNGDKLQTLLAEYTDPLNVDWVDLIKLVAVSDDLLSSANKTKVVSLFTDIYDDADYGAIVGKLIDLYLNMTVEGADQFGILVGLNGLETLASCDSQKTATILEFMNDLMTNDTLQKMETYDLTNANNLAVLRAIHTAKDTLEDIDGFADFLEALDLINDSTAVNNTIDFALQFTTVDKLADLKNMNYGEEAAALRQLETSVNALSPTSTQEDINNIVSNMIATKTCTELLPANSVSVPDLLKPTFATAIDDSQTTQTIKTQLKSILGIA